MMRGASLGLATVRYKHSRRDVAGVAGMLRDSGKTERELPELSPVLKIQESPEQLTPNELEEGYDSKRWMMLPLAFAWR